VPLAWGSPQIQTLQFRRRLKFLPPPAVTRKRDYLRSLGVGACNGFPFRSIFADEILADHLRAGIDVVLNSLPGEAITKSSIGVWPRYGRFWKSGKPTSIKNRRIGLWAVQDNLSYPRDRFWIGCLRQRPAEITRLYDEIGPLFETRRLIVRCVDAVRGVGNCRRVSLMSQRKTSAKSFVSLARGDAPGNQTRCTGF